VANAHRVVAVGETGLDHYRKGSPLEDQRRAFRTHIALSIETGKPLVVHVRDAWEDAMRVMDEAGAERVVLHCFTGDEATAREAAARGYIMSFAGNVTYPNATGLRAAAATVPADQLVMETDSPFLPPQHMRGQPNAPASVAAVAEELADLRGTTVKAMIERTTASALAAFPALR
jgi:TatD DNase family protein